jgi:hypothetical protein
MNGNLVLWKEQTLRYSGRFVFFQIRTVKSKKKHSFIFKILFQKGRPLLARSHPPKMVIALSQAELDKKAEQDEFNYFFGP